MRKLKAITFLFLVSGCILAQAPGYMGKKTVAGYGFYINPAITAALIDYGTKIINTQHEFFIERALKRGLALGFSAKLYRSTYNNTGSVEINTSPSYYSYYYPDINPTGSIDIKGRNYALYFKLSRKGYVVPWGKYVLLGLAVNTRQCRYDPEDMYVDYETQINSYLTQMVRYSDFGPTDQSYIYPDIMFGGGNSRIIKSKIVLDYGYNINVAAMTAGIVDAWDVYSPTALRYIQTNTGMRVRGINRFNLFFKIGYLF